MKSFEALTEKEVLALAISLEEEDERVYADFAEGLRETFPASAAVCDGMRQEESGHRRRLIELYQQKFGEHIPLIRRQDVRGFVQRKPVWLVRLSASKQCAGRPAPLNSRRGDSTRRPQRARRTRASANFSTTWPTKNAITKNAPMPWKKK